MRTEIALKCMVCDEVFEWCVNGVQMGIDNLPQVYNIGFSVCPDCVDKLKSDPKAITKACKKLKR